MLNRLLIFFILFLILFKPVSGFSQFIGKVGVYFLGGADIPIAETTYSNPDISGVVCRFRWENTEISPDKFNWDFVDGEIEKARNANKYISLQPLGKPDWLVDSLHVEPYYYIDQNQHHSTYGEVLASVLPWDSVYVGRVKNMMRELAKKYANDTIVSYINHVAGYFSRNLPDTVVTDTTLKTKEPFWEAFDYNADTLAMLMDSMIVYYMDLFPQTPLWCSVDYVRFEMKASGRPLNYLASCYTDFGISNYPDRFGLFREDLSACTPYENVNTGSQWMIMKNNSCRTGAQMLWSVQDGPTRMNQCGDAVNNKQAVLDSAVQKGIDFGMRYLEIYGADINDEELAQNIDHANNLLINQENRCNELTEVDLQEKWNDFDFTCYPNPVKNKIILKLNENASVGIFDVMGRNVYFNPCKAGLASVDCSNFPGGVYIIKVMTAKKQFATNIVVKH